MDLLLAESCLQTLKVIKLNSSPMSFRPFNLELLTLECNREDDELAEAEHAVVGNIARFAECLFQLFLDRGGRVEQVDLAVLLTGAHLGASQARHHGVHQVSPLGIAQPGKNQLGVGEDLALVNSTKLSINAQVLLIKGLQAWIK